MNALLLVATIMASQPCILNQQGAPVCPLSDGRSIRLNSSVFDFSKADCRITPSDKVYCANVRVFETTVKVNLIVDYKNHSLKVIP